MSNIDKTKFEYGQSGWRQSIAVNITAQIIWVMVPIVFISGIFLFNEIEKDQTEIFSYKLDALNHRVSNVILNTVVASKSEQDRIINKIATDLGFRAIEVSSPEYWLTKTTDTTGFISTTRTVPIYSSRHEFDDAFIVITAYHTPLNSLIKQKRKNILLGIFFALLIFAAFLVFSIRKRLYTPLKLLVDATETVAEGSTDLKLDTSSNDEFGHLSLFFNRMVANLREQHDNLKQALETSNEASRAKSAFLANMSHELRTPLNAIIGYSEIILDEAIANNDEQYINDLRKTISASKHLLTLINEVLDLSKIEAGKMETYFTFVDLNVLVNDITSTIEPQIKEKRNRLEINIEPGLEEVNTDAMKLRQILINLLGNAAKFTENGLICLSIQRLVKHDIHYLEYVVSDTGIGIDKNILPKLFTPFTQEDDTSTRNYGGTGLGLTISRRLSELLGGTICVSSVKGKGSNFTLTLPYSHETEEADTLPDCDSLPRASGGN